MRSVECAAITCMVHADFTSPVDSVLEELGVRVVLNRPARMVMLRRRSGGRPGLIGGRRLADSPCELVRFHVACDEVDRVMEQLIVLAGLDSPGRGSLIAEPVTVHTSDDGEEWVLAGPGAVSRPDGTSADGRVAAALPRAPVLPVLRDLTAIACLVPRGLGDSVARVALELGTCVPVVSHGTGVGNRDRLGLLRVTIPADKEIVHLVVPRDDATGIMRLTVEEARLNQPGRGFLYTSPVSRGMLNTRLALGRQQHAATMEQIIAAVDDLRRSTSWRRRFSDESDAIGGGRGAHQTPFVSLTIYSREGAAGDYDRIALDAGATGATRERVQSSTPGRHQGDERSHVMEKTTVIVAPATADRVQDALIEAGLLSGGSSARLVVSDAPLVYSYRRA